MRVFTHTCLAGESPEFPTANANVPPAGSAAAPQTGSSPPADVARPPATNTGSPINAGTCPPIFITDLRLCFISQTVAKLGLLPKRPVNLMSSQPTSPTPRHEYQDDDDELDYVENPFEETRK